MPQLYDLAPTNLGSDIYTTRAVRRQRPRAAARAEREAIMAAMPPDIRAHADRADELEAEMNALYSDRSPSYGSEQYWELEEQYNQLNRERSHFQNIVAVWEEAERVRIRGEVLTCDTCYSQSYANDGMHSVWRNGRRNPTCKRCVRQRRAARDSIRLNGRKFGIEIEFEALTTREDSWGDVYTDRMDPDDIVTALRDAGIDAYNAGYSHAVGDQWKLVSDSSVEEGWELVSPPLTWDQRDQVHTVCQVLEDLGADAAPSCGLHVHHEVRDLNLRQFKRLVGLWTDAQDLTDALVDRTRTGRCEWCAPYRSREIERLLSCDTYAQFRQEMDNQDRYRSLNLTAFRNYGTVEVRQHQGTLDSNKILAWVQYGQTIIDAAKRARRPKRDHVHTFLDTLPFKCAQSRDYLKQTARAPQLALGIRI